MRKIDTKAILDRVDLSDVIASSLGQPVKQSGKYVFWQCPFHDDNDPSMAVTVDRYHCFGCRVGGDAIAWLMNYEKLSFLDACKALSPGLEKFRQSHDLNLTGGNTAKKKERPDDLQDAWCEIIDVCQSQLWSDVGKGAREYLHGRGLTDKTLQSPYYRVGFSIGQKIADIWVDRGIVLPCFVSSDDGDIDFIDYIKIRRGKSWVYRPQDKAKYRKLYGGQDGLYGANWVLGADLVFIVEGELDSILLDQEAGDLVGVCTLGGASDAFDWSRWGKYLSFARWLLVAYDHDQAGDAGAEKWQALSGRVRRVYVPTGKDITDAWQSGVNLSDWVMRVLADNQLLTDTLEV